jgi:hypothetical protein
VVVGCCRGCIYVILLDLPKFADSATFEDCVLCRVIGKGSFNRLGGVDTSFSHCALTLIGLANRLGVGPKSWLGPKSLLTG